MTFKTLEQMKAGMVLAGLSKQGLAAASGVSPTTLSNLENDPLLLKLTFATRQKLETVFTDHEIEFIDNEGVRKAPKNTIELKGREGFANFRQRVLKEVRQGNADICIYNLDERLFDQWGQGKVNDDYRGEMAQIRQNDPTLKFRSIVQEGDLHLSAAKHSEYRWVPESMFETVPYYIYGNNCALLLFEEEELTIIIIRIQKFVDAKRGIFNTLWGQAKKLDIDPLQHIPKGSVSDAL